MVVSAFLMNFNSIKVRLNPLYDTETSFVQAFQFHKGRIKPRISVVTNLPKHEISIP